MTISSSPTSCSPEKIVHSEVNSIPVSRIPAEIEEFLKEINWHNDYPRNNFELSKRESEVFELRSQNGATYPELCERYGLSTNFLVGTYWAAQGKSELLTSEETDITKLSYSAQQ